MRAAVRSACVTAVAGLVSALLVAPLTTASVHATAPAAGPHEASGPAFRAPHPVDPSVRSYAVRGASDRALRTLSSAKTAHSDDLAALSDPRPASGFAVTGVTWTGRAPAGLSLAIRTRTGGAWSRWTPMEYDAEHGPSPTSAEARKAKPGTDPFVVGAVDDVQLKATSDTGRAPTDLTLDVVDPGTSGADASPEPITPDEAAEIAALSPAKSTSPANMPVAARSATPMPNIFSRADWGADERLRDCCVEYGEVHAGFVHHTVNANGYSRREVPAILRGIYAYHTQSRGWRDIGYNYLIDRFGRIWEGRYGGITMPVVGAHTLYYNENSFAASAIGNYETAQPSSAMIDAYARLYAWKLSLHGVRPGTRQNVAGTTFTAISGHRDAAQTACPGRYLYAKIPTIIEKARQYQHIYTGRALQHSFVSDRRPDLLMLKRGQVVVARGTDPPGFAAPAVSSTSFAGMDRVAPVRDVTGDGLSDVMARERETGRTSVYPGLTGGGLGAATDTVARWADADIFVGVGDVTGDAENDVVARSTTTHELRVYPGRGDGTFGTSRVAIADASGFNLVTSAGDFDGDGFRDLLTRGIHGAVFVWFGDGTGAFPRNLRVAHDWSGRDVITGGFDLTGDALPDVVARSKSTHVVSTYANLGGRRFSPAIGHRVSTARFLRLSTDLSGDGGTDLTGVNANGKFQVYAGHRSNWLRTPSARPWTWPGTDKVLVVGDWDGDGYVDAMGRRGSDGTMRLYRGNSRGGFEAPIGRWTGWNARRQITPVGDFNGDGRPDLMAQVSSGAVYLYPGRGKLGFGTPRLMRSALPSGATVVGVGLWNTDGAPDVVVRNGSGQLLLYPGNGPGGLDDPRVIGSGYRGYSSLIGVGDLTGDGHPDLVGRLPSGQTWLIPGVGISAKARNGGFGPRQYLAANWSSYLLG
jgi:hypothetical protein